MAPAVIYEAPVERDDWEELRIVGRVTYKTFTENRSGSSDGTYDAEHHLNLDVITDEGIDYRDLKFDIVFVEDLQEGRPSTAPLSDLERLHREWLRGPPLWNERMVPPSVVEMVLAKDPHWHGRYWIQSITDVVNNCPESMTAKACLDWSE